MAWPDLRPPRADREHLAGNHVMLRCADADVLLGHLRPGSLQAALGARVRVGDRLAEVGNSGNTGEPHLHIHAQRPGPSGAPVGGDPLHISFDGRFLVRGGRVERP
jgi:murein DD-endopeptidase MepM/ murein hydrolase activator NlpD